MFVCFERALALVPSLLKPVEWHKRYLRELLLRRQGMTLCNLACCFRTPVHRNVSDSAIKRYPPPSKIAITQMQQQKRLIEMPKPNPSFLFRVRFRMPSWCHTIRILSYVSKKNKSKKNELGYRSGGSVLDCPSVTTCLWTRSRSFSSGSPNL